MIFEKQIVKMYKGMAYSRCDDSGCVFYFSADDFEGLNKEPYSFVSSMGNKLQGYIYSYSDPVKDRLVIFDHGMGGGHRSYMKEIEMLARHGYTVLAYDHTGCMESEGESTNGMSQSLRDLNDCVSAVKNDARFCGVDLSVVGHSWGGYSCLNITALHPDISHVVVISGFVSVELLVNSYFGGIMKGYRKAIMKIEEQSNPDFVSYNAVETLLNTKAKVLLIYSDNDKLCNKEVHYDVLKSALRDKENIKFLLVEGKGHNPNFTADAVKYKDAFFADLTKMTKKKKLVTANQKAEFVSSYDWQRMTAQDESVWAEIFSALES